MKMDYYLMKSDNIKQEVENGEEVECEDEVEILWHDTTVTNEVDPLTISTKKEVIETPSARITDNSVYSVPLSSNANPILNIKSEYCPQTSCNYVPENELRANPNPECMTYDVEESLSSPSPSSSIFDLSSSDEESGIDNTADNDGINIINLVPALSEYINKLQSRVQTSLPNQISTSQSEKDDYKKLPIKDCRVLVEKLPDIFLKRCNLMSTNDGHEFSTSEYNVSDANIKSECPSPSPSYDDDDVDVDEEEHRKDSEHFDIEEEKPKLSVSLQNASKELFFPNETHPNNIITQDEQFFCNICIKSFKRLYSLERHNVTKKHKMNERKLNDTSGDTNKMEENKDKNEGNEELSYSDKTYNEVEEDKQRLNDSNQTKFIKYQKIDRQGVILFCCNYCQHSTKRRFDMEKHWKSKKHSNLLESRNGHENIEVESKSQYSFEDKQISLETKLFSSVLTLYTCNICNINFNDIHTFNSHNLEHNNTNKNHSGEVVTEEKVTSISEKRNYSCSVCKAVFKDYKKYNRHQKSSHSNERVLTCGFCKYKTLYHGSLKKHRLKHHRNEKYFTCKICKTSFNDILKLKTHTEIHLKEKLNVKQYRNIVSNKRGKFECPYCKAVFVNANKFINHKSTHLMSVIYNCRDCDFKTGFFHSLKRHRLCLHGDETSQLTSGHIITQNYCCNDCGFRTDLLSKIQEHKSSFHETHTVHVGTAETTSNSCQVVKDKCNTTDGIQVQNKKYRRKKQMFQCQVCKTVFRDFNKFRIHRTTHLTGKLFFCDHCEYRSILLKNLERHKTSWHSDKKSSCLLKQSFVCPVCKIDFDNYNQFEVHKKIHLPPPFKGQLFSCDACEYKTKFLGNLKKHKLRIHFEGSLFKCTTCQADFKNHIELNEHISVHHCLTSTFKYICPICSAGFNDIFKFQVHKTVHEEGKSITCDFCEYKTSFQKNIKIHITKKHSGNIKSYKCSICEIFFTDLKLFLKHKFEHEENKSTIPKQDVSINLNTKQYCCDICEYIANDSARLKIHKKQFHTAKYFKCNMCEYKTVFTSYMSKHKQKCHSNKIKGLSVKIYTCDKCEFSTSHKNSIERHQESIHEGKLYSCHICSTNFNRKDYVQKHIQRVHKSHLQKNKTSKTRTQQLEVVETIEKDEFSCCVCSVILKSQIDLLKHMKHHFPDVADDLHINNSDSEKVPFNKSAVQNRNTSFSSEKSIKKKINVNFSKKHACNMCSYSSNFLHNVKRHIQTMHLGPKSIQKNQGSETEKNIKKVKLYKCNTCSSAFTTRHSLTMHMKCHVSVKSSSVSVNKTYENNVTDKNVDTKLNSVFTVKDKNTKSKQKFSCDKCFSNYLDKQSLDRHILLQHKKRVFSCSMCDFQSFYKHNLDKHTRTHHLNEFAQRSLKNIQCKKINKDKIKSFKCHICLKVCSSRQHLEKHLILHFSVQPLRCNECPFRCYDSNYLKKHKLKHTVANTESVSDNLFRNSSTKNVSTFESLPDEKNLESIKNHSSENATGIVESVQNPSNKISLYKIQHKNTNASQKNNRVCTICSKIFSSVKLCKRHMVIHTGEKQWACDWCQFRCNDKYNLNKHKRSKHAVEVKQMKNVPLESLKSKAESVAIKSSESMGDTVVINKSELSEEVNLCVERSKSVIIENAAVKSLKSGVENLSSSESMREIITSSEPGDDNIIVQSSDENSIIFSILMDGNTAVSKSKPDNENATLSKLEDANISLSRSITDDKNSQLL